MPSDALFLGVVEVQSRREFVVVMSITRSDAPLPYSICQLFTCHVSPYRFPTLTLKGLIEG